MYKTDYGIDEARRLVNLFSCCSESFNQRFTLAELITLARCYKRSEYDFAPDRWSSRQVEEAITLGRTPTWDADERCVYQDRDPTDALE